MECMYGKYISVEEIIKSVKFSNLNRKICPICKENFIPTQPGGKKQVICKKPKCDKEFRRLNAIKIRKKKKLA
jgi:hypothetical protein